MQYRRSPCKDCKDYRYIGLLCLMPCNVSFLMLDEVSCHVVTQTGSLSHFPSDDFFHLRPPGGQPQRISHSRQWLQDQGRSLAVLWVDEDPNIFSHIIKYLTNCGQPGAVQLLPKDHQEREELR